MGKYEDFATGLINRQKALAAIRLDYEDLWRDVIDFINIRRYDLDGTKQKGKKVGESIYDSTALDALKDLADGFFGYLISPAMQWFSLRVQDESLMRMKEVKMWLEEATGVLYTALQRSNFYDVMPEYFQDGGSIGTATLYSEEEEEKRKIIFTVCHPGGIWIAENKSGMVDTVFRQANMTARQASQRFGKDNPELSEDLREAAKRATGSEEEFEFYHIVMPNPDVEVFFHNGEYSPSLSPSNKPFLSYYVQVSGRGIPGVSGYYSNPYQCWRWRKNSNEIYGRGCGSDALIDILTSNQISKTMLHADHLATEPPLNVPSEMRSKVRITPRGMNFYEDQGRIISAVQMGDPSHLSGRDREEKIRASIRKHFMTEFFTLLSKAALEGRQLSVPQVLEMQGEKAVMLGTIVGRLNTECFDPLLDRVYQIESMAGRMPPPPDVLLASNKPIHVEYLGPLAQAQRRLYRTQGIYQGLEALKPIAEVNPRVFDAVDFDEVGREILEASGAPSKIIKDPERLTLERKEEAQRVAAQLQAELAIKAASQVPSLSKTPEEGSPIGQMMKG